VARAWARIQLLWAERKTSAGQCYLIVLGVTVLLAVAVALVAFLDALWANVPMRLPLLRFRKLSKRFFGLNLVGLEQFEQCFDQWYSQVPDKLVGI